MKQSLFLHTKEIFPGSDIVRKYTFRTINTRDNCALLARANRQLSQDSAILQGQSALLVVAGTIQTAIAGSTRDYSALFGKDCVECLSPHENAA